MILKGEKVIIEHTSDGKNIIAGKKSFSKVDAIYINGNVRVTSGDVWKVKRINGVLHTRL